MDAPLTPVRTGPRDVEGWHTACRLNEIRPGRARYIILNGVEIALARDGDDVYGVAARCPHKETQLADGKVQDGYIVCPLHGCTFDLRSGISPIDPSQKILTYETRTRGEWVDIDTDSLGVGPGVPDTYLGRWRRRIGRERDLAYVHALADGAPPSHALRENAGFGTSPDHIFHENGLSRPRSIFSHPPLHRDTSIETTVTIGARAARPLTIDIPILIGHVSYGEVSIEAKVALARGSRQAGTAMGSGDGGSHGRERDATDRYIVQVMPGEIPSSPMDAEALEIWLGESRHSHGPHLPAHKVTTEVSLHRGIPSDVEYQGNSFTLSKDEFTSYVDSLRNVANGVPIGVKLPARDLATDLPILLDAGIDFVTVEGGGEPDGRANTTADTSPVQSTLDAIEQARTILDSSLTGHGVTLIAAGGIRRSADVIAALSAGADAASLATAALWALGCQNYGACHGGNCPVGIATQDPELRLRLNPDISARRVASYLSQLADGVAEHCRMMGINSSSKLGGIEKRLVKAMS